MAQYNIYIYSYNEMTINNTYIVSLIGPINMVLMIIWAIHLIYWGLSSSIMGYPISTPV